MYYKVLKNNKVIDVLDRIVFLKWSQKHNIFILCNESEAQAILSSDKNTIWHVDSLYRIPVSGYDSVILQEIDVYEYRELKVLNYKTPEEIIDAFVLTLIDDGIL